jgi:NADH-quinone oxidoreductase subunit D
LSRISHTGVYAADAPTVVPPPKDRVYTEMEALIQHFLIYSQGFVTPPGESYVPIEGPRGEQGFYVVSDGTNRPWRVKSRAPSLLACQALERLLICRLGKRRLGRSHVDHNNLVEPSTSPKFLQI